MKLYCLTFQILLTVQCTSNTGSPCSTFEDVLVDHVYCAESCCTLSEFSVGILEYISGFIVRKLANKMSCLECYKRLTAELTKNMNDVTSLDGKSLLQLKNNGGLKIPSTDVVHVVKHSEKVLRSTFNMKQMKRGEWGNAVVS
jgi:hypothetical protein